MSITDELRKYASLCDAQTYKSLNVIADRIDAEHEQLMGEQYKSLTVDMQPMTDENMAEGGWVRLPVDADGEYIRVGDKMDGYKETIVVDEMRLQYGSWALVSEDGQTFHCPEAFTHHKATVEDMLRDFAQEMNENLGMYTGEAIEADEWRDADAKTVAKYADRIKEALCDE